jgi:hypothetical protein
MKYITFKTDISDFQAQLIRATLQAHGIPCIIKGEWNYEDINVVQIPAEYLEKANLVYQE